MKGVLSATPTVAFIPSHCDGKSACLSARNGYLSHCFFLRTWQRSRHMGREAARKVDFLTCHHLSASPGLILLSRRTSGQMCLAYLVQFPRTSVSSHFSRHSALKEFCTWRVRPKLVGTQSPRIWTLPICLCQHKGTVGMEKEIKQLINWDLISKGDFIDIKIER